MVHTHIVKGTHNQYDFVFAPLLAPLTKKWHLALYPGPYETESYVSRDLKTHSDRIVIAVTKPVIGLSQWSTNLR